MKYLLDTHILIWLAEDSKQAFKIKRLLQDINTEVFVSVATIWELVIKKAKGKLDTPKDIEGLIDKSGFTVLPIEISHVLAVGQLPTYKDHSDPFDRILVSQAKAEGLTLITSDPKIWKYKQISLIKA